MTDPSTDSIIQTKICAISWNEFSITQQDMDFYAKISPTFAGQVFHIPTPTLCPEERERRRLSFRNERNLYRRTCDATGKEIISIYSPDKPYKVYDQKIRWSDSRDPMDYGREFDFNKTFTEQFSELMKDVPAVALVNEYTKQENCGYVNSAWPGKNCYLSYEFGFCEDVLYSKSIRNSNTSIDCMHSTELSSCYECVDCANCYACFNSQYCDDCSFCTWCYNCKNCQYCINCDWLENKSYCIENKQYASKEEFEQAARKYVYKPREKNILENGKVHTNENAHNVKNVVKSKNVAHTHDGLNLENVKYGWDIVDTKDTYDYFSWWENVSLCYEMQESWRWVNKSAFLYVCWDNIANAYYSFSCINSSDIFGCVWVRNKQYCIFNKQYTKNEYEKIVAKIITHMQETWERGEFFHPSLSPFGYNETVAQDHYPLQDPHTSRKDAQWRQAWYKRSTYQKPEPKVDKIIPWEKLPTIWCTDIDTQNSQFLEDIIKYAIKCEITGKLFRIIPQEITFYKKHNLPLPRRHPDQRHVDRLALRNK